MTPRFAWPVSRARGNKGGAGKTTAHGGEVFMATRGGANLAWSSDYAQFYLMDARSRQLDAPVEITPELTRRRWSAMSAGLVVYTNDCLQEIIEVRLHDREPPPDPIEWRSGKAWTQIERAVAVFPSRRVMITGPSNPIPAAGGPFFELDGQNAALRISWMEFEGSRDDSVPVQPDVIRLDVWPA